MTISGKISSAKLEEHQFAAHALAWLATYVEALRQMRAWAGRIDAEGRFGEMEGLILQIGFGEYLSQIHGGIPMSQGEIARLQDMGVTCGHRARPRRRSWRRATRRQRARAWSS